MVLCSNKSRHSEYIRYATESQGVLSFEKETPFVRTVLDGICLFGALRSYNGSFGGRYAMEVLRVITTF